MKVNPTPPQPELSILEVLRQYPGFRRLWQARVASLMGDWFNTLALFAMLRELGANTPATIGILYIVKLLPMFLLGPAAGVIADRYNRASIMVITDILRFGVVLCFLLVPMFPDKAAPFTLFLALLQACLSAFFEPSKAALMPNLVPSNGILSANAVNAASWSVCYALGTGLGGIFTHAFGWRFVIVLDAFSYIVSAVLVLSIGFRHVPRKLAAGGGWKKLLGITDMAEGFAYLKGHPRTTYVLFFKSGLALAGATEAVFTLLGEHVYSWGNRPDLGIGALLASRAIGTGLGPIVGRRLAGGSQRRMIQLMLGSFVFSGASYFVLPFTSSPIVAMICAFCGAFGSGLIWVFSMALLQILVPDQFRGRVFSADLGMAMAFMAVSIFCFTQAANAALVPLTWLPIGLGSLLLLSAVFLFIGSRHPGVLGKFPNAPLAQ